jgi:prevent-host-death family protein
LIQGVRLIHNSHQYGHVAQDPMQTVSIAQAKDRLTELLREAEAGRPVAISRRGRTIAVLLAEAEYERLRSAPASTASAPRSWRAGRRVDRWHGPLTCWTSRCWPS